MKIEINVSDKLVAFVKKVFTSRNAVFGISAILFGLCVFLFGAQLPDQITFSGGHVIYSSQINTNFKNLWDKVNMHDDAINNIQAGYSDFWTQKGDKSTLYYESGNVGIGTTSPGAKLQINGTLLVNNDNFDGITSRGASGNSIEFRLQNTNFNARNWNIFSSGGGPAPVGCFGIYDDTSAATRMVIDPSGNVGIGTTNPVGALDVYNGVFIHGGANYPPTGSGLEILKINDNLGTFSMIKNPGRLEGELRFYGTPVSIYSGANERMRITSNGNVGIGTASPTHLLTVGTSGAGCDGGNWITGSSRTYKENISNLTTKEAIETVKNLNPVKFNYKTDKTQKYLGFIAEDVPDLVAMKDRKGLSSMDIDAVLVKVVQEQQKQIDELKKEIASLKDK
jgi:hypothetical protein